MAASDESETGHPIAMLANPHASLGRNVPLCSVEVEQTASELYKCGIVVVATPTSTFECILPSETFSLVDFLLCWMREIDDFVSQDILKLIYLMFI